MTISRDAESKSGCVILPFLKIDLCRFCDLQRPQDSSVVHSRQFLHDRMMGSPCLALCILILGRVL
ncbi:hypothetical protein L208DRAFT_765425 [Tricholoma matsutake]|nr:hypothetical protein L208DRAFT_765425 [Tricholoma matsutake 945]